MYKGNLYILKRPIHTYPRIGKEKRDGNKRARTRDETIDQDDR
jgi:hypothetical protein